jgi:hypothetical protein
VRWCGEMYAPAGARMDTASRFQPLMATIAKVSATISAGDIGDPRRRSGHVRDPAGSDDALITCSIRIEQAWRREDSAGMVNSAHRASAPDPMPVRAPRLLTGRSIEPHLSQHRRAWPTSQGPRAADGANGYGRACGWAHNLMDEPDAVGHPSCMFQRTVPNRDQVALEREALRSAGDLPTLA